MASAFLASYLESIDTVPGDLQRNFTMMHDLDRRVQDLMKEVETVYNQYLEGSGDLKMSERAKYITDIKQKFEKSNTYSDDKVQLAMQTYEMVDKHIRRLDTDLQRLEAKQRNQEKKSSDSRMYVDKTTDKKKKKGGGSSDLPTPEPSHSLPFSLISGAGEGLDMPVDPNEPTYCLCHQVSYGEMIGCDNSDCPVEWFHFACVGLTTKPKGSWFCPLCTKEMGK